MRSNVQLAYLETEVMQADGVELVRLLYRGALDAVGKARQCVRAGNIKGRSKQITKVSEILNELATSLDVEQGGEIGKNLAELYDYMQRMLIKGNFEQVEAPLAEVEKLLATILAGWEGIVEVSLHESKPASGYNRPVASHPY
jgi:flagellar protein FliS